MFGDGTSVGGGGTGNAIFVSREHGCEWAPEHALRLLEAYPSYSTLDDSQRGGVLLKILRVMDGMPIDECDSLRTFLDKERVLGFVVGPSVVPFFAGTKPHPLDARLAASFLLHLANRSSTDEVFDSDDDYDDRSDADRLKCWGAAAAKVVVDARPAAAVICAMISFFEQRDQKCDHAEYVSRLTRPRVPS